MWANGQDTLTYIIVGIVGVNFLVELGVNVVLSPVVVKIIDAVKKTGNVVKEGENAVLVETGDGNYYYAYWGGQHTRLYYGKFDPATVDVNIYNGVTETDKKRVTAPGLMKQKKAPRVEEYEDYDYGELESPPADDL